MSRFLDIEAEVSEEEEEEEEEEEFGAGMFLRIALFVLKLTFSEIDTFITNENEVDDEVTTRRSHALLDRRFEEEDLRSPEEIARAVARRHRDRVVPYTGDMNEIPQRLLMPSVHDASLWQVRVKVCHYFVDHRVTIINVTLARTREGDCIQSHAKGNRRRIYCSSSEHPLGLPKRFITWYDLRRSSECKASARSM